MNSTVLANSLRTFPTYEEQTPSNSKSLTEGPAGQQWHPLPKNINKEPHVLYIECGGKEKAKAKANPLERIILFC